MEIYKPERIHIPTFENITFYNSFIKECIKIELTDDDLNVSNEAVFWCAKDKGNSAYAKGLTKRGPSVAFGLKGEIAFAKLFGLSVYVGYKKYGQKTDFDIRRVFSSFKSADIKTSESKKDRNYIRVVNERGDKIPITSDIYVGSFWDEDTACVYFTGWNTQKELLLKPIKDSRRKESEHKNIEMLVNQTRTMLSLFYYN